MRTRPPGPRVGRSRRWAPARICNPSDDYSGRCWPGREVGLQREGFVGRAKELDALKGFLEGDGQVLAVHGMGGIGKSALVGRFKELAETAGVRVSMCNAPNGTIGVPRFLREVSGDLGQGHAAFDRLNAELDEYLRRESVLEGGGGAAGGSAA